MSTDVSSALIAKSDQLNGDDLIGGPIVITITKVTNLGKGKEQPVIINYVGDDGKPWKPCKSMGRVMAQAWGTTEGALWVGRKVQLYRDPAVMFGKDNWGGIRISHLSHIDGPLSFPITVSRGKLKPYPVKPLKDEPTAAKPAAGGKAPTIGADEPATPEEIKAAKAVAAKGSAALEKWWLALDATMKKVYAPHKEDLKRQAEDSDAADPADDETREGDDDYRSSVDKD